MFTWHEHRLLRQVKKHLKIKWCFGKWINIMTNQSSLPKSKRKRKIKAWLLSFKFMMKHGGWRNRLLYLELFRLRGKTHLINLSQVQINPALPVKSNQINHWQVTTNKKTRVYIYIKENEEKEFEPQHLHLKQRKMLIREH